ncbi:hypothetical protein HYV86_07210 [Candidatus Woesearchaeota archaeon]|nr:hypothetical protein [Candidatus Woesearchaeota archaeon]
MSTFDDTSLSRTLQLPAPIRGAEILRIVHLTAQEVSNQWGDETIKYVQEKINNPKNKEEFRIGISSMYPHSNIKISAKSASAQEGISVMEMYDQIRIEYWLWSRVCYEVRYVDFEAAVRGAIEDTVSQMKIVLEKILRAENRPEK